MLNYLAFSGKLNCIQHQNALRLAPKRTPFCTKTHSILQQNALHFAAKRTLFCSKQPRNRCKWQPILINIHYAACRCKPLFASKQTFARIDFLRQGWRLVDEKGTHNVKFLTKNQTKPICGEHARVDNGAEGIYAYDRQREWLQYMLLMDNGSSIIETLT